MPKSIEDLINAGPDNSGAESKAKSLGEMFQGDEGFDKPIKLDAFDKVKEGIESDNEEILKKEEEKADKDETTTTQKVDVTDKKESVEVVKDKNDGVRKSDNKAEEKEGTDESDSLIHLELGISPNALSHFKNMNKAAREWITSELKSRYQKITELSNKVKEAQETKVKAENGENLPAAWYEHPQAVQLLPEYQQAVGTLGQARNLLEFYRQQKVAIAEGETWYNLEQDAQGNWKKVAYKADAAATDFVDDKILSLREKSSKIEQHIGTIQNNFNSNAIKSREQVVALENQYFPQYKDDKELEKNNNYKAIRTALNKYGVNNDRLSGVVAKMYLYTMDTITENEKLQARIKELEANGVSTTQVKKSSNGPTGDEINRGSAKAGKKYEDPDDEPVSMDIFDKIREVAL